MKSDNAVVNGRTFLVTDRNGRPTRPHDGFYHRDVRHLDGYDLRTDRELETLELFDVRPGERVIEAGSPLERGARTLRVRRRQFVADGLYELVDVQNLTGKSVEETLVLDVGTRFDDLFEVRSHRPGRRRDVDVSVEDGRLDFRYDPDDVEFERRVTVQFDLPADADAIGDARADGTLSLSLSLDPHERVRTAIAVGVDGGVDDPRAAVEEARVSVAEAERSWLAETPLPDAPDGWRPVLEEARENLLELRLDTPYGAMFSAGVPWFAAAFGRDSLITAYQSLHVAPAAAKGTCRYLAAHQAETVDDFRAAEPGKILHEIRHGECAAREEVPHSPYYGTVDATALFVVLVHETWRYTGDDEFAADLWPNVRRALSWLDEYGDRDGDGFVDYPTDGGENGGLTHQAWKDSGDGIVAPDGSHPEGPLAVAEVQGYAYDALRRGADLAREFGDDERAATYDDRAASLRAAFDEAFWLPEESFYAVALDGRGDPVPSVASNPGHCLWSGIVPEHRADAVVDRLLGDDIFSGWGIRTLSATHEAYNPQSYHLGSIWPHDNSLAVLGMARYGRTDAVERVSAALVEAARARGNDRLPELFAGYDRDGADLPVTYGEACEPQAWAAATPFACLRALRGEAVETLRHAEAVETPTSD
jgi:glycogen debranching enzyme